MRYFFTTVAFLVFIYGYSIAQLNDDFSDSNLDGWEGNTDHFIVNTQHQLQLNAPEGSTNSWLYTNMSFVDSMSWDIYIKLDFAPSTSNQLRIYLGLTENDVSTASGYYLEIGASGDQDALDLKYQDAGNSQSLASSLPGLVANEPVELRITITKNASGLWQCFNATEVIPELLFSTVHDLLPLSSLNTFSLYCKYTDTRRDKFYFDNISIQPILADVTPPEWISLTLIDDNSVSLLFNESLDASNAMDPSHYELTPGNNPQEMIVSGNEITLTWASVFVTQQHYILTVTNISDVHGNVLLSGTKGFDYIQVDQAEVNDILITEIMADPTPVIGLPDAEYLEVFNNSIKVFNLSDYRIRIGSSEKQLPARLFLPGEYVIITDEGNIDLFLNFGTVIGVANLPALTNSGTTITLLKNSNEILQELNYSLDWYRNEVKSNGGWSLELNNSEPSCDDESNWSAANNLTGGTPGAENSQWHQVPDFGGPILTSFTNTANEIEIGFHEKLHESLMLDPGLYPFVPDLDISFIELSDPETVTIHLASLLQEGIIYELLPFGGFDCFGNEYLFPLDTIRFGTLSVAEVGDVLINEILFNPATGGSRYIEIINATNKFFALSTLSIARISTNDIFPVAVNNILGPGEIAVFTPDRDDILARYNVPRPVNLYESSLPAWDDKTDDAAIISGGAVIDSLTYSSSWHHPVISDQNGVSLERISLSSPASSSSNWHSASSLSGYGTPTRLNSQTVVPSEAKTPYHITNRHFSPNDDGFNDFLLIGFEPESGKDVVSIWAYDLEGREIYRILSNETIGYASLVQWDGRNAEGLLADMGIYLIFIQLWDADGNVKQFQESCAIVKR